MNIVIASEGNRVSGHFGHCQGFTKYKVINNVITEKDFIENPGHKPGFLPVFLKEKETDVIIAGGMGEMAVQLFNENGIEVIVGAAGLTDDVMDQFIGGELHSTGSICTEHAHEGHCND